MTGQCRHEVQNRSNLAPRYTSALFVQSLHWQSRKRCLGYTVGFAALRTFWDMTADNLGCNLWPCLLLVDPGSFCMHLRLPTTLGLADSSGWVFTSHQAVCIARYDKEFWRAYHLPLVCCWAFLEIEHKTRCYRPCSTCLVQKAGTLAWCVATRHPVHRRLWCLLGLTLLYCCDNRSVSEWTRMARAVHCVPSKFCMMQLTYRSMLTHPTTATLRTQTHIRPTLLCHKCLSLCLLQVWPLAYAKRSFMRVFTNCWARMLNRVQ